jgi:hypothetical protein
LSSEIVFALQTTAFRQPESKKSRQRYAHRGGVKRYGRRNKPQQELNLYLFLLANRTNCTTTARIPTTPQPISNFTKVTLVSMDISKQITSAEPITAANKIAAAFE